MQKVIDFMGDDSVWDTMVPGIIIKTYPPLRKTSYPVAYYLNSHWTCRKPNETTIFDPWDHYQKPDTHRFCQTFAMMYLLDALPPPNGNYKSYDMAALKFIKLVLDKLPSNHPGFLIDSKRTLKNVLKG